MKSIVEENLLRNFEMIDPLSFSKMVKYEMPDSFTLIAFLDDGTKLLYDSLTNSTRRLKTDPREMTDEDMLTEFRYRLRHIMALRGFNQLRLAEETGISQVSISKYLNGKSDPSLLNLLKIARALDCSLDELRYI